MPSLRIGCSILICSWVAVAAGQNNAEMEGPFARLFDTGQALPAAPPALDLRAAWTLVPEEQTAHVFQGDAVLLNDKLALLLRAGSSEAVLYTREGNEARVRARLRPASNAPLHLDTFRVLNNAQDLVAMEAAFSGDGSQRGLRFELPLGQPFVKVQAAGAAALTVEAPAQFSILPDFFADDIVINAEEIPVSAAELPSENFLVNLLEDGDALVMSVWDNRKQDVRVTLGSTTPRRIEATEIAFGEEGSIWVAAVAEPEIWHLRSVSPKDKDKILPLSWQRPFPAVWRVDWRRDDALTDSWEMAVEMPTGKFEKSELFAVSKDAWTDEDWWNDRRPRRRWNTFLGGYAYPCWFDKKGKAFLQPLKEKLVFDGPAVIYPINRTAQTPLDRFTVTDIVRGTLGVGPCQYILDVEGQDLAFQGRPTCDVRDTLNPIYENGEQAEKTADISKALDDVLQFIRLIRGRIEQYGQFSEEMKAYLTEQRAAHPELATFFDEMDAANGNITGSIERRRPGMKTPEYAQGLVDEFRTTLIGYQGADALDRCKKLTAGFVDIGNNQDELVAECRRDVKLLRQRAALAMAQDPRTMEVVKEIRARTQAMLRDPVNYEAARH